MKIAIVGLGLIGGSIGLAMKQSGRDDLIVVGIPRREETVQEAVNLGAIDEGTTDLAKGIEGAEIIFICTPINLIIPILKEIAPHLAKGTIVADVGSSKYEIVSQAEKIIPKGRYYVGGHPMAGKETFKLAAAEKDLFLGKTWILTQTAKTGKKAMEAIESILSLFGCRIIKMDPKTHDLVVAAISHLPLAIASTLVNLVVEQSEKELMAKCASSGFRDTTRIASGDPLLGLDMFTTNKKAVLKMIALFKKELGVLEKAIKAGEKGEIEKKLKSAKAFRDSIFGG